jgi:hypothetical protein
LWVGHRGTNGSKGAMIIGAGRGQGRGPGTVIDVPAWMMSTSAMSGGGCTFNQLSRGNNANGSGAGSGSISLPRGVRTDNN